MYGVNQRAQLSVQSWTALSAATLDEGATSELFHIVAFTGSAVAGALPGDVIVMEIWFQTTQGGATSRNITFAYDGTTVGTENGAASNTAAYIETPKPSHSRL